MYPIVETDVFAADVKSILTEDERAAFVDWIAPIRWRVMWFQVPADAVRYAGRVLEWANVAVRG